MIILDIVGKGDNYYKATVYTDIGEPMSTFVMFTDDEAAQAYTTCRARAIVAKLRDFKIAVWRHVPGVPAGVEQLRGEYETTRPYGFVRALAERRAA